MHAIVRLCLGLVATALGTGLISAPAKAEIVTAGTLNCRSAPSAQAPLIAKLSSGQSVTVLARQASWSKIEAASTPQCWVSSRFLSGTAMTSSSFYSRDTPARATRKRASSASTARASGRSVARPSRRSSTRRSARRSRGGAGTYGVVGTSCPCSGSNICVGPRGGRYCITSGGNKRYGV